jgi:hypothetical protein
LPADDLTRSVAAYTTHAATYAALNAGKAARQMQRLAESLKDCFTRLDTGLPQDWSILAEVTRYTLRVVAWRDTRGADQ